MTKQLSREGPVVQLPVKADPSHSEMLGRLRIRHLSLVVALDELRNLHRAAQAVHLSQPSASKQLQDLELLFGSSLFDRLPTGMQPTELGVVVKSTIPSIRGVLRREPIGVEQVTKGGAMTKTAVITGGAGGIGLALAARLMHRGYRVVLVDIDQRRLAESAAQLGAGLATVRADLTVPADLARVAELIECNPELELLVNGAGVILPGAVIDLSFEDIERHIAINLLAPLRLSHAAARVVAARGAGCILSIVSSAGLVALPGSAAYSASKFGLRGFLIALSQELSEHGVKVRGVFPGAVDTPMLRYEATHGGSALNFLNKEVLSADEVGEACLRAIDGNRLETILPFWDGVTAKILSVAPGLMKRLLPYLQKQGEAGLQRFLKSRGLIATQSGAPPTPLR